MKVKTSNRIKKLVQEYVQTETRLLRTLLDLKAFYGERAEVRKAYLDATLKTPTEVADSVWGLLVHGPELADWFDEVLLDLKPDANQFTVADALLTWAKERGWTDQVQAVMNADTKALLEEQQARGEILLQFAGAHETVA